MKRNYWILPVLLVLPLSCFELGLDLIYNSHSSYITTNASLIAKDGLQYENPASLSTILIVAILFNSLTGTTDYKCNDAVEVKSKYEDTYICGHYEEGTLNFTSAVKGSVSPTKIQFLKVTAHSIPQVDPPVLLHIGLALCRDERSITQYFNILQYGFQHHDNKEYVLNTEVEFNSYYSVQTVQARDQSRYIYLYFEAELNAFQVQNYRPYVPYNDNIAIFDSGLSFIQLYNERYDSFVKNFVETYCQTYQSTFRCECEGKNYGLLPTVGLTMADQTYYLSPTDYTFDAYIERETYQTWCDVGIRVNYFETTREEHFNLLGTLMFMNYNLSYAVTDSNSFEVRVGLQGGGKYTPLQSVTQSSILYSIVVVGLCVVVIILSLKRRKRLQFEDALMKYNPDKYLENMMRIHQGTKKHQIRLEANRYNVEEDDDLLSRELELKIDKVDKKLIEKLESNAQFREAVRANANNARRARTIFPINKSEVQQQRQTSTQWV